MEDKEVEFSPKDKILDRNHIIQVLKETKSALKEENAIKLKDLSNQTIHCATCDQESGSLAIAIITYALSKIIEREDKKRIKNWPLFVQRFNSFIDLAIKSAQDNNPKAFNENIIRARKTIVNASPKIKGYLEDTLKKATINKASKLYEHGISLGQTAQLLGLTQWEISEYTSQGKEQEYVASPLSAKQRVKMALEFLS